MGYKTCYKIIFKLTNAGERENLPLVVQLFRRVVHWLILSTIPTVSTPNSTTEVLTTLSTTEVLTTLSTNTIPTTLDHQMNVIVTNSHCELFGQII